MRKIEIFLTKNLAEPKKGINFALANGKITLTESKKTAREIAAKEPKACNDLAKYLEWCVSSAG